MQHWTATHAPPDAAAWLAVSDFGERLRRALRELYTWYAANGADLYPIYRDAAHTPDTSRRAAEAIDEGIADALLAGVATSSKQMARQRSAIILVVGFWGWHSLAVRSGLTAHEAADLATTLVLAA
jgi:hypothetical protein